MEDDKKTKKQLVTELENLRQQVAAQKLESNQREPNIKKPDESDAIYKKIYENNPKKKKMIRSVLKRLRNKKRLPEPIKNIRN